MNEDVSTGEVCHIEDTAEYLYVQFKETETVVREWSACCLSSTVCLLLL